MRSNLKLTQLVLITLMLSIVAPVIPVSGLQPGAIAQTSPSATSKPATAEEITVLIERLKNPAHHWRIWKAESLKQAQHRLAETSAVVQLAQTQVTRMTTLVKEGAVSKNSLFNVQQEFRQAQADRTAAEQAVVQAKKESVVTLTPFDVEDDRLAAAGLLGRIGEPAIAQLMSLLDDANPNVRGAAAWALGHIGESAKAATPKLFLLLKDSNPTVRRRSVSALGVIGIEVPGTAAQLEQIAEDDPDPAVRKAASEALDWLYYIDNQRIRGV